MQVGSPGAVVLIILLTANSSLLRTVLGECRPTKNKGGATRDGHNITSIGRGGKTGRIIGGNIVSKNELPYQLSLKVDEGRKGLCGATILSPYFAVTAAHCVVSVEIPGEIVLVAGDHKLLERDDDEQRRKVWMIMVHPEYKQSAFRVPVNDIAILKVFEPFEFNDYVQKAELPDQGFVAEGDAIASGWGCAYEGCAGDVSKLLKKVTLPIVPFETCQDIFGKKLKPMMLCAGGVPEGGRDACQGDSGGPLVLRVQDDDDNNGGQKRRVLLVGITSWGEGCACPGTPGVYTNVSYFRPWIQDRLDGKNDTKPPVVDYTSRVSRAPFLILCRLIPFSLFFFCIIPFYKHYSFFILL